MKVRIRNNEPTAEQRKALKQECIKEFDKLLEGFNRQTALQILFILRFDFGFGQERLKRFADRLSEMQKNVVDRYEVIEGDIPDICEIKLRDSGIDVGAILE